MIKAAIAILMIAVITFLLFKLYRAIEKRFKKKEPVNAHPCKHQIPEKTFLDLNDDPRCIHCGFWLSRIAKIDPPDEWVEEYEPELNVKLYTAIYK